MFLHLCEYTMMLLDLLQYIDILHVGTLHAGKHMFSHCMLYVDILHAGIFHVCIDTLHVALLIDILHVDILHAGILHVCIDILH